MSSREPLFPSNFAYDYLTKPQAWRDSCSGIEEIYDNMMTVHVKACTINYQSDRADNNISHLLFPRGFGDLTAIFE